MNATLLVTQVSSLLRGLYHTTSKCLCDVLSVIMINKKKEEKERKKEKMMSQFHSVCTSFEKPQTEPSRADCSRRWPPTVHCIIRTGSRKLLAEIALELFSLQNAGGSVTQSPLDGTTVSTTAAGALADGVCALDHDLIYPK